MGSTNFSEHFQEFTLAGPFPTTITKLVIRDHTHSPKWNHSFQVTSPGNNGWSSTTLVHFRDRVPRGYDSRNQFAGVREVGAGIGLQNTGRIVTFNVKMDANE